MVYPTVRVSKGFTSCESCFVPVFIFLFACQRSVKVPLYIVFIVRLIVIQIQGSICIGRFSALKVLIEG